MTKEIVEKMDVKHRKCLETYKESIKKADDAQLKHDGKMRIKGYLLALQNCDIITQSESRILYTYFTL